MIETETQREQKPRVDLDRVDLEKWHRVMIVDDDPAVLAALRRELAREPYEVITMRSPEGALSCVAFGKVSLVITDQRMPGLRGVELLERVWRMSPTTTGILLTGYPDPLRVSPDFRDRLDCVLHKPWNIEILKPMIRRLLHHRETGGFPAGQDDDGHPLLEGRISP